MAKPIVSNIISLDGFCAGQGGNPPVLPMDAAFDEYNAERLRSAATLLLGRTTFEMFRGYWPSVDADPTAKPVVREIARLNRAIDKVVVSDSLKLQPMSPWSDARVVRRAEAWEFVTRLKADVGKDILVFGSRLTRNGLMADGLVDELHLMIGGVILGTGVPAFGQSGPGPLRLINQHRWSASDNVLLQSACAERS